VVKFLRTISAQDGTNEHGMSFRYNRSVVTRLRRRPSADSWWARIAGDKDALELAWKAAIERNVCFGIQIGDVRRALFRKTRESSGRIE
jgi:hypothetical protein